MSRTATARGLDAMIQAVLKAPHDPGPLLVLADWLETEKGDGPLAYACRWMARWDKRPFEHPYRGKNPWCWLREGTALSDHLCREKVMRDNRGLLPCVVCYSDGIQQQRMNLVSFKCWLDAVRWLAKQLAAIQALIGLELPEAKK